MDIEQQNAILDILIEKIPASELQVLVFKVLGPQARHNLCGSSYSEKCTDLMENVGRWEIEDVLVQQLGLIRPDIDLYVEQGLRQAYTIIHEYETFRI